MQTVICKVQQCGYCSVNGFCLNRLTVINEQGLCKYLTYPGWEKPVEDWMKNTYVRPEDAAVGIEQNDTQLEEEGDGQPRD